MLEIPDVIEFERLSTVPTPIIDNEAEKKKEFGMALGQGLQAFEAACQVCGDNTNQALFISQRWLNDPIVIAAKDIYLKTVYNSDTLLDADQLASKLLQMAEERNSSNTFYMLEGKDRLAALALYAKIKGFTDKAAPINNNFTYNSMKVKFVAPDKKEEKIIDELPPLVSDKSPVKLKLVS